MKKMNFKDLKLASLFSGGKDSNYSLYLASKKYKIKCLISMISKNEESYMFQSQGNNFLKIQSELLGIPIIEYETSGKEDIELNDLEKAIKLAIEKYNINGIVTGAIGSTYQASRIQKICNKLNILCFNPLWQINEEDYLNNLIKDDFKIILIAIASYPFTKELLGKEIDINLINKFKKFKEIYKTSLIGEGGEFETFVLDSPLFKKRIKIIESEIKMDSENSGKFEIKKIKLINKTKNESFNY